MKSSELIFKSKFNSRTFLIQYNKIIKKLKSLRRRDGNIELTKCENKLVIKKIEKKNTRKS